MYVSFKKKPFFSLNGGQQQCPAGFVDEYNIAIWVRCQIHKIFKISNQKMIFEFPELVGVSFLR